MSMRIHVVGAFGATESELRTALDRIGGEGCGSGSFRIGSSGNWAWANASVWQVGGSDIDDALGSLAGPALRVTSSDAVLWMLALTGAGKTSFHGVHHFTAVGAGPPQPEPRAPVPVQDEDFPDDELEEVAGINRFVPELQFLWDAEEEARLRNEYAREQAATVEGLDDYVGYGVQLPEDVIENMRQQPHRAHYTAFMAHGQQIVDALDDFGLEFDREEMLEMLTVGPLTELERDSDIGNMPRFLQALGIDGVFREATETDPDSALDEGLEQQHQGVPPDWAKYPPGNLFKKVESLMEKCELDEIAGGPVQVTQVALLHLLAHSCCEDPVTFVTMEYADESVRPNQSWMELPEFESRQNGPQFQCCFESPSHWWFHVEDREDLQLHDLTEAVGTPPAGTRIELVFVVSGLAEHCHRYWGVYTDQGLELHRAYPKVTAAILTEALELVDQVFETTPIRFNSQDEENAVRRTYQRSQDEIPRIRNRKIMPEAGSRSDVVQTLLFKRFEERGPWDIAGARKLVEEGWEWFDKIVNPDADEQEDEALDSDEACQEDSKFASMLKQMSEAVEEMKQARIVPHGNEVVYEGRTGQFLRASMADLEHVSEDQLAEHDAKMAELGFQFIGDFVGDADQRQEISRCYVGQQAVALLGHRNENNQLGWADVSDGAVLVDFSQGTVEFHTDFEDGTALVTTSIDATSSKPEAGVYVRAYEEVAVRKLWEKHLDGIERFRQHHSTVPVDHLQFGQPVKFLANVDELLCHFMGLE